MDHESAAEYVYQDSPRTDGRIAALRDELLVSGLPLNIHSNALAASINVKSGSGMLFGLTVTNTNAAGQYIQIFDAYPLPADNAVPVVVFAVGGASTVGGNSMALQYLPLGRVFLTGITICNSSTAATKTIGSADCFFDVQFI